MLQFEELAGREGNADVADAHHGQPLDRLEELRGAARRAEAGRLFELIAVGGRELQAGDARGRRQIVELGEQRANLGDDDARRGSGR